MNLTRTLRNCVYLLPLLIASPAASLAADPPGIPDGWSDGFVYANGARLHYYHAVPAPDKPPLVMVHGITDNGLCWTTLALKLQANYDIYMLDARSHGLSDPIVAGLDGDTLIKDVVAAVGALDLKNPILMGHSMGAQTVMRVGAEYPKLAKAVIMLDPMIGGRRMGGTRRGTTDNTPRNGKNAGEKAKPSASESAKPTSSKQASPSTAPKRLSVSMNASPEVLVAQNNYPYEDLVAKCRRDSPQWGIIDCQYWALSKKQYHGAYSNELFDVMSGAMRTGDSLGKIPAPTLILKADASPEDRKTQLEAASVLQNGKLVHVDHAGHNLHHDQLDRTVELLTEFLSTL